MPYDQTLVGRVDTQWLSVELHCTQTLGYSNVQANWASDPLAVFSANSAMRNLSIHRGNSPGDYMVLL